MIKIQKVENKDEGYKKAHQILAETVSINSLLALSGGSSVNYNKMIVASGNIHPGDVCVIDERYGNEYHENSNELLIKNSQLLEYLEDKHIPFSKYLQSNTISQTAEDYDQIIRTLFNKYDEMVGVMGVGTNMHTAGIFPNSKALKSSSYVVSEMVDDHYPQRLTVTIKALEEFTTFIIMLFGEAKKEALNIMMDENENNINKYPAIFYRKCNATVHVVTDIAL